MLTKQDLDVLDRLLRKGQFDIAVKIYRSAMDCDRQTAEDFLRKVCDELKVQPPLTKERK
jgi:hypothetical protein